ncbi:MAG: TRAP transporter small permease subunit [Chloroflexi bacterium]|nr:TRAP transporter small permease subunit [Chloroflexota bacterium]
MNSEEVSVERAPEELVPPMALAVTIKVIDSFGDWVGKTLAWLVIPLMGGLVYEVFARYVFNRPQVWVFEMTFMIYGGMFMLGASYTLLKKMHIRTDILYERFPVRWQGFVDGSLYLVIFFPGLIFLLDASWDQAFHSFNLRERSEASPWMPPIWPMKMAIPVGTGLLLIQGFSELLKSLYAVWRGKWL